MNELITQAVKIKKTVKENQVKMSTYKDINKSTQYRRIVEIFMWIKFEFLL